MNRFLILCCIAIASISSTSGAKKKIPDYVPICKRADPDLSECYRKSFNIVLLHMGKGIPEMNLRQIDPLHIEELSLNYGNGSAVSFSAVLHDMQMFGFEKMRLEKADVNLETLRFTLQLFSAQSYLTANFNAKGKVLLLQFDSSGSFRGNLTNMNVTGVWSGKKTQKNGKDHIIFTKSEMDVRIGDIKMYFDNLFPSKEINDRTNEAINENIDILYEEIKPIIVDTVKAIVIDSVNNVYDLYPLETLFPE